MKSKKKLGFSIIELLIAIAVFVLLTFSTAALLFSGRDLLGINKTSFQALLYAREGEEAVRAIRDGSWDDLSAGDHGLTYDTNGWHFNGTSDVLENKYRRTVSLVSVNQNKFQVISQVKWFNRAGQEKTISLSTNLTNWQRAHSAASGEVDLGDSGNAVYVQNNYVYLAVDDQHKSLAVVDASDPANPQLVKTVDLNGKGRDVVVNGNYVYIALSTNKIIILKITDPTDPQQVASINISAQPNAVFVKDGYLYIGQNKSNEGLVIYNVANPELPYFYASYNVKYAVHDVKVKNGWIIMTVNAGRGFDLDEAGNYAYVAEDNADRSFVIYRAVYTPWALYFVTQSIVDLSAPGRDAVVDGNNAYLAIQSQDRGLVQVDVTSATEPKVLKSVDVGGEGNGVFYQNGYAYVAVENISGGLKIVNMQ